MHTLPELMWEFWQIFKSFAMHAIAGIALALMIFGIMSMLKID